MSNRIKNLIEELQRAVAQSEYAGCQVRVSKDQVTLAVCWKDTPACDILAGTTEDVDALLSTDAPEAARNWCFPFLHQWSKWGDVSMDSRGLWFQRRDCPRCGRTQFVRL
jgi:hypothetical protein